MAEDDRYLTETVHGEVLSNMELATSARDLSEQFVETANASQIQFRPNNPFHATLNYAVRLKVHYMVQQRVV